MLQLRDREYVLGIVVFVLIFLISFQVFMVTAERAFMSWPEYDQPYKPVLPPVPLVGDVKPLGNHVVIIVIDGASNVAAEANMKKAGLYFHANSITSFRILGPCFLDSFGFPSLFP